MLVALILAASNTVPHSHGGHTHTHALRQIGHAEMYRPTPMPDRVVLTWNGDPSTTQAVTWRTDRTIAKSLAQIVEADDGPNFLSRAKDIEAVSIDTKTDINEARSHTALFTGLTPKTTYAYRVGDGVNWTEWFQFRTAAATAEPFSFVYFGDAQNDVRSMWSRVIREAFSDAPRAAFFLHAGDLINKANSDGEWGEWFGAGGWLNGMIPVIATPGNHEYAQRAISGHWRPQFEFPLNGPVGLEESTFYIDYQGVRIISLNSNEKVPEQAPWLREVLSKNPNRWTVVTLHHPVYSTAKGRDNPVVRDTWQPIFDEFRVDLVLQGHDHTYGRTNLATGSNARSGSGTVYVVSVSGPKMYEIDRKSLFARIAEQTQLYQVIHVDRDTLRYEAKTAAGRLYDAFTLRKNLNGPNSLETQAAPMPERTKGG